MGGRSQLRRRFELGEMHGEGVYRLANGSVYEGPMRHNAREGRALTTAEGNTYDGDWVATSATAGVETIAATGERYEGDFATTRDVGVRWTRRRLPGRLAGRHGVGEARDAVSGSRTSACTSTTSPSTSPSS